MEGINSSQVEIASDQIRKGKLESVEKLMVELFGSVGNNAIKRIMTDPTFADLTERS